MPLDERRLRLAGRWFDGLDGLQAWTDQELRRWAEQRLCPATGATVAATTSEMDAIDPSKTAAAILKYHQDVAAAVEKPYTPSRPDELKHLRLQAAAMNGFTRRYLTSFDNVYLKCLQAEARRRAVRILIAVHLFHLQ